MIRFTKYLLFIFSILLSLSCFAGSANEAVNRAAELYQSGEKDEAIKILKTICDDDPHNLEANLLLGEYCAEIKDWDPVTTCMKRVLKLGHAPLLPSYYLAIGYREKGYYASFLLRTKYWKDAEKYFQVVFAEDSTYNKILYEYAVFKGYREEFKLAIDALQKHLIDYPEDRNAFYKIYFFYDAICFKTDHIDSTGFENNGPLGAYFTGEYYRQHDQLKEAKVIFDSLRFNNQVSQSALYISLARTAYQLGQQEYADAYYKQAIEAINSWYDTELVFHDIKYVFSDPEMEFYRKLKTFAQAKNFFTKSWLRRDPYPTTPINLRIIEHIERSLAAEKEYRKIKVGEDRLKPLYDENVYLPEIHKTADRYDDRGLIYIRYGSPDEIAIATGGDGSTKEGKWYSGLNSGESWLYKATADNPKKIFHFIITDMDYRIVPLLPAQMLQDVTLWDPKYHAMVHSDEVDQRLHVQEMTIENNEAINIALQADLYKEKNSTLELNIPYYLAAFIQKEKSTSYELYYSLTKDQFNGHLDSLSQMNEIKTGVGIYDKNWNPLYTCNDQVSVRELVAAFDTLGYWPGQYTFQLDNTGLYYINFYVQAPQWDIMGGEKLKFEPAPVNVNAIYMSDLEPAAIITPVTTDGQYVKNELLVMPKPDLNFQTDKTVYIYFELYNLPVHDVEKLDYHIQYKVKLLEGEDNSLIKKISNLFTRNKNQMAVSVEGFSQSTTSIEYMGLNFDKFEPGFYELEISVSVPKYNIQLLKSLNIRLIEP